MLLRYELIEDKDEEIEEEKEKLEVGLLRKELDQNKLEAGQEGLHNEPESLNETYKGGL